MNSMTRTALNSRLGDLAAPPCSLCYGGQKGACPSTMKDDDKLRSLQFIQIDHVSMRSCISLAFWQKNKKLMKMSVQKQLN